MIINEKKGENRNPAYLSLWNGQPLDPVFVRYAEEKKQFRADWILCNDAMRIYEDSTGHFCLAKVSEADKSRNSSYSIHVTRGNNPSSIASISFTKPSRRNGVVLTDLCVAGHETDKRLATLLMGHAMDIVTKTLGVNQVSLCAHPGFLVDIKRNCTAAEIQQHKKDLVKFYEGFGFRKTGESLSITETMRYVPEIGYRRPLEYYIGECKILSASAKNKPLTMNIFK